MKPNIKSQTRAMVDAIKAMADRVDTEILIRLVEARPNIWDKYLPHKDTILRNASWQDICRILNPAFIKMGRKEKCEYVKLIIKRWTNIRDTWKKSIGDKKKARPYVYHEQLKFLLKNLNYKPVTKKYRNDNVNGDKGDDNAVTEETTTTIVDAVDATNVIYEDIMDYDVSYLTTEGQSEDDISEGSWSTSQSRKGKVITEEIGHVTLDNKEDNSMQFIDRQPGTAASDETSHHISFIKGLLPILNELDEDQNLEFQSGVIKVLQDIRSRRSLKIETIKEEPSPFTYISSSSFDLKDIENY